MTPTPDPRRSAGRTTRRADLYPWPESEVAAFAFRCHALGATEDATTELLDRCVPIARSLDRYWRHAEDADLLGWIADAEAVLESERSAGALGGRRGDLMRIRSIRRWPWRTSTSQTFGGVSA